MSRLLRLFFDLLQPRRCPICGKIVCGERHFVCASCYMRIPFAPPCDLYDSEFARLFWHLLPIERAWFMMHYVHGNPLIIRPKFNHAFTTALCVGRLLADRIPEGFFDGVDAIVPVPSTRKRLRGRRFHHLTIEAETLVESLHLTIPVLSDAVIRVRQSSSQIGLKPLERRYNVRAADFAVRRPERLEGRHIALLEDMSTTGATLLACGTAICLSCPHVKLSVIAVSRPKRD